MKNKSFTLIELLVVIVIIGILAGVIIVSTSSSISKANFAKAQAFSNTVQQELLLNLVSEWTFDNTNNPGEDTWGNNDGTLYGTGGTQNLPQLQPASECVYGTCLNFDGTDDYVNCGNNNNLNLTNSLSLSAWIKINGYGTEDSIAVIWKDYQFGLRVGINQVPSGFIRTTASWRAVSGSKLSSNSWHHLVFVYDGMYGKVYIDSIASGNSLLGEINQDIYNFHIGAQGYSRFFNGYIDDARIYNAALSSSQIKQEYIAGLNSLLANNNISKEEYNQRLNNLAYDKE